MFNGGEIFTTCRGSPPPLPAFPLFIKRPCFSLLGLAQLAPHAVQRFLIPPPRRLRIAHERSAAAPARGHRRRYVKPRVSGRVVMNVTALKKASSGKGEMAADALAASRLHGSPPPHTHPAHRRHHQSQLTPPSGSGCH